MNSLKKNQLEEFCSENNIFIKLPETMGSSLDKISEEKNIIGIKYSCTPLKNKPIKYQNNFFYLEMLFSTCLHNYFLNNIFKKTSAELINYEHGNELINNINQQTSINNNKLNPTINELLETTKKKYSFLETQISSQINPQDIIRDTNIVPIYTPTSEVTRTICELLNNTIYKSNKKKFFLMFDNTHNLENWQKKVINSFVSSSAQPCYIKITSKENFINENTNGRLLSNSDIKLYDLTKE